MSRSTLILNPATTGSAQINPKKFPANIILTFSPQDQAQAFYGLNGTKPSIPLKPGQSVEVTVTSNSLQLDYRIVSGEAKLAWEL
ncbi:hypothetical protein IMCC3317_19850 [Kordia antarctica]|uniref:Uncharacterized protein n=1 Tax=Kordia antarctica TaxID=1218801 RepID=A0A7L4ZJ10_9FLAO|nr:hypothetical protein [Kordia antarctica]QHI36622.1 hypothetical protein IMCC3317_19850 [Kordia antarctica]